jgi:hypothetical protein
MARYLIESKSHHCGETDSQSVIVCEACRVAWFRDRAATHDDHCEPADTDLECENCGSQTALDSVQDLLNQISNRLEHETNLSSTERRALYARGVELNDAIKRGPAACEQLLKVKAQ